MRDSFNNFTFGTARRPSRASISPLTPIVDPAPDEVLDTNNPPSLIHSPTSPESTDAFPQRRRSSASSVASGTCSPTAQAAGVEKCVRSTCAGNGAAGHQGGSVDVYRQSTTAESTTTEGGEGLRRIFERLLGKKKSTGKRGEEKDGGGGGQRERRGTI